MYCVPTAHLKSDLYISRAQQPHKAKEYSTISADYRGLIRLKFDVLGKNTSLMPGSLSRFGMFVVDDHCLSIFIRGCKKQYSVILFLLIQLLIIYIDKLPFVNYLVTLRYISQRKKHDECLILLSFQNNRLVL